MCEWGFAHGAAGMCGVRHVLLAVFGPFFGLGSVARGGCRAWYPKGGALRPAAFVAKQVVRAVAGRARRRVGKPTLGHRCGHDTRNGNIAQLGSE